MLQIDHTIPVFAGRLGFEFLEPLFIKIKNSFEVVRAIDCSSPPEGFEGEVPIAWAIACKHSDHQVANPLEPLGIRHVGAPRDGIDDFRSPSALSPQ